MDPSDSGGLSTCGDLELPLILTLPLTSGVPVGISSAVISSSEMPSRYLSMPRIELPCAAMSTVLPAWLGAGLGAAVLPAWLGAGAGAGLGSGLGLARPCLHGRRREGGDFGGLWG